MRWCSCNSWRATERSSAGHGVPVRSRRENAAARTTFLRRNARQSSLLAALLFTVLSLACTSVRAVTEDEMYVLWAEAATRFETKRAPAPPGSEDALWVQRVGGRIAESWPDRRWVTHRFLVVVDPLPGAWSFPVSPVCHNIYVTTGLLKFIRSDGPSQADDQLAGVLGHEIAHLVRDHHLLRHRRAEMLGLDVPDDLLEWPARVLGTFQKEDEFEADRYGAFYALHAGYEFEGILRFLARYMRRYGDEQFLDSLGHSGGRVHPALNARIAALQQERRRIEAAIQLFECGLDLVRAGAWDAARACFAEVRNTFWLSPTVAHNLAYVELKLYEAALPAGPPISQSVSTSYSTELRIKGPTVATEVLLAEARADFLKACELDRDSDFGAPWLGLACTYLYQGGDAKASACLQELQVGMEEAAYLNLTGVIAERAGDLDGARRAYCKALHMQANVSGRDAALEVRRNPHPYLPALYNLARVLESQGQTSAARELYRLYLTFEGNRSFAGTRARDGLLRCGGRMPESEDKPVVDTYRGIYLQSSGTLVVKAALGEPETETTLTSGRGRVTLYEYPSQGVSVLLVRPGMTGETTDQVVRCLTLFEPNRERVAGIQIGDSVSTLKTRLGNPRAVTPGTSGASWWDYAPYGLAFCVEGGRVQRCLIGGWH
jgi:Zn-dependent protease with chaperone function